MLANLMFYTSIKSSKAMLTFRGSEMLSTIWKRLQRARSMFKCNTSEAFTYSQSVRPESLRCFSHIVVLLMESFHLQCAAPTPFHCNWVNGVLMNLLLRSGWIFVRVCSIYLAAAHVPEDFLCRGDKFVKWKKKKTLPRLRYCLPHNRKRRREY